MHSHHLQALPMLLSGLKATSTSHRVSINFTGLRNGLAGKSQLCRTCYMPFLQVEQVSLKFKPNRFTTSSCWAGNTGAHQSSWASGSSNFPTPEPSPSAFNETDFRDPFQTAAPSFPSPRPSSMQQSGHQAAVSMNGESTSAVVSWEGLLFLQFQSYNATVWHLQTTCRSSNLKLKGQSVICKKNRLTNWNSMTYHNSF